MKHKNLSGRILSLVLTAAMVGTMLPTTVFAAQGDAALGTSNIECHVTHDDECGYTDAVAGSPAVAEIPCDKACQGEHSSDCAYESAVAETPCDKACQGEHSSDCAYKSAVAETPCDKACQVEHSSDCAYEPAVAEVPAIEGAPCTHSCEICRPLDGGEANVPPAQEQSAYDRVVALFTALPNASELTEERRDTFIAQLTEAMETFEALTAEEQALFMAEQAELYTAAMALNDAITGAAPVALEGSWIEVANVADFNEECRKATGDIQLRLSATFPEATSLSPSPRYNLSIDLNGRTLTSAPGPNSATLFYAGEKTLTIIDSSPEKTGGIVSTGDGPALDCTSSGSIVLAGGTIENTNSADIKSNVISFSKAGTLTIQDGATVQRTGSGSGVYMAEESTLNMEGGTIEVTNGSAAISRYDGTGVTNISGGVMRGNDAVALSSTGTGTITITGGTLTSTKKSAITMLKTPTLTISGDTTKITSDTTASDGTINWSSAGTLDITGGVVENTATGNAITSQSYAPIIPGKITISNTAEVTSKAAEGTITLCAVLATAPKCILDIQGGTVSNTASPEGYSIKFTQSDVTADNINDYYTAAEGATVGKVYPAPFVVSFDTRNDVSIPSQEIKADMKMPADPTWEGYTFDGWYIGIDGAAPYYDKLTVADIQKFKADTTIYAKWTKTAGPGKIITVRTEPLVLTDAGGPTAMGQGWSWNKNTSTLTFTGGADIHVADGETAISIDTTNPATIVLMGDTTVHYSNKTASPSYGIKATNGLTIRRDDRYRDSGSLKVTGAEYGIHAKGVTIAKGTLSLGGTKAAIVTTDGITAVNAILSGQDGTFESGVTKELTQRGEDPVVLRFPATISFSTRNESTIADMDVVDGMALPPDPTWPGQDYVFDGWYSGIDGTDAKEDPAFTGKLDLDKAKALTENTTVYAKWTKNGKTVLTQTLDLNQLTETTDKLATEGWKWDEEANILTLDGFYSNADTVTRHGIMLQNETQTIVTHGVNRIIVPGWGLYQDHANPKPTVTFGGDGELYVEGQSYAMFFTYSNVVVESGKITAIGEWAINAGELTIKGGDTTATGTYTKPRPAVYAQSGLTLTGGKLTASNTDPDYTGYTIGAPYGGIFITAPYAILTGAREEFVNGVIQGLTQKAGESIVFDHPAAICFDAGNGDAPELRSITGGTVSLPDDPTWDDYHFAGWYTDEACTTPFQNKDLTTFAIVYAKWTKDGNRVYTRPLDFTAATGNMSGDGYEWDNTSKTLTLSGATVDCSKSEDAGWDSIYGIKLPDGSAVVLASGTTNTVRSGKSINSSSYGIWFADGSGDTVGGTIRGTGTLNVTAGDAPSEASTGIESVMLTIESGIVNAKSGSGGYMSTGISANQSIEVKAGTIHSTAGTAEMSVGVFSMATTLTGGNITATGHTFALVSFDTPVATNATITGSATLDTALVEAELGDMDMEGERINIVVLSSDKTIPALSAKFSFAAAVNFDSCGGSEVAAVEIKDGTIAMPADPAWGSYTFAGWYTDKAYTTQFVNSDLTDSVTVYAKWTNNGKTVVTQRLDLTNKETTDKLATEGWKWDKDTNTLTLSGLTLDNAMLSAGDAAVGILFPEEACTIILIDGTENTVDVSRAQGNVDSTPICSQGALTIKTSGTGTPGKLNAIAGNADDLSAGIYGNGGIVIESGNITATAGESTYGNSIGISADAGDIHIKGGTVTATGSNSGADISGGDLFGSFGLYGTTVQIDDGTVTATGGDASLSGGIVGGAYVTLNGGSIHAKGDLAAVAAIYYSLTIDDIANVTVNDELAAVGDKNIGLNISTLVDESDAIIADAIIKFKPAYTGTNPKGPSVDSKTTTSITLKTQTIANETVEYGKSATATGEITWQDNDPTFTDLTAGTDYYFYTRIKSTSDHKAGPISAGVMIKTAVSTATIGGTVTDKTDAMLGSATVTIMNGQTALATTQTGADGKYTFGDIPFGTYSLVVEKGPIKVTTMITIDNGSVTVNVKLPDGSNTVVETKPNTPPTAAEGLNDLFDPTTVGGNTEDDKGITQDDLTTITGGGSVTVTLIAEGKQATEVADDVDKIKVVAPGKALTLLDLRVNKVITPNSGTAGTPIAMTDLPTVIEIVVEIPEYMRTATDIAVYRVHGNAAAEKLPDGVSNKNPDGEYVERNGNYIHVFTKKFSTYALGYTASSVSITSEGATGVSGAGSYAAGAQVTIDAGSKSGYTFDKWEVTSGGVTLADAASASTTFIMPAGNVTVTANWTYNGGSGDDSSGDDDNSSDGSDATTYHNTVKQPDNGTVSIAPRSPAQGQTVTITTKPDTGYVVDAVIVKDASGKTIAVTEKGMNSYTFVQPGSKVTVEVTYKNAATSGEKTFTDVTTNDWFYDAVMTATAKGWFSGTSETTFSPNMTTSRGMIATILHNMERAPSAAASSFADVPSDAYYANGVAWVQEHGIVAGYGNGNYGPNDAITREQLASILYRYAQYKGCDMSKTAELDTFADASSVSDYAKDPLRWAVGSGIISGRGNNTLAPTASATRAEVATILVRLEMLFAK